MSALAQRIEEDLKSRAANDDDVNGGPGTRTKYTYDTGTNNKGRLMEVEDNAGTTAWTYSSLGRVTGKAQAMGITKAVGYGYNSAGQLVTVTTPSGQTLAYSYTNNRITGIVLNSSVTLLSGVTYDPFGPTTGWTWGNSTLAVRNHDEDGLVTDIDSAGLYEYAYDDAFRITGIEDDDDANRSWTYGYDSRDRLTSASQTGLSQTWTYDTNGNRLTQGGTTSSTFTVSSTNNRLSSVSGGLTRTYSYDNAGNTTAYSGLTFTYSDSGRMTGVSGGASATYSHNALGHRVKKVTGGNTTYFVYDEAGHLIGEYTSAGNLIQETVWLDDIPVVTLRPDGSGGVNVFYVHTDHLNTPRRISRPSDNVVVWRWDSDPFGTASANQDPDGDSTNFVYNLRFPGQYYDAETGLTYNYFRDYESQTGRYVQSDPIGMQGGINTYSYVGANPVELVDRFGLVACDGKWVKYGDHVPMVPTGRQAVPLWTCSCYWLCVSCRGPVAWDGNVFSLPSTKGVTYVDYSGVKPPNTGSGGMRPTPKGPSRGGGGAMGGAYSCLCSEKPGPEKSCDDGRCYPNSNFYN